MTFAWLLLVAGATGDSVYLTAEPQCDHALVTTTRAELAQLGFDVHLEPREGDVASLSLRCTATTLTAHLEVPANRTTVDRLFMTESLSRPLLALKLSELVYAASRPDPLPVERPREVLVPPVVALVEPPLEPARWFVGAGVGVLASLNSGVTPSAVVQVARRISAWELGLMVEGGLPFVPVQLKAGAVKLTMLLGALTVARRFELTSRWRLRVLAGPSALLIFASAIPASPEVTASPVMGVSFAATAGAGAEYELSPVIRLALGLTASWAVPRAMLRAVSETMTIAEPLVGFHVGVFVW